jgi:hypothetical protein
MRILADAAFPTTVHHLVNAEGLVVERLSEGFSDVDLLAFAVTEGYRAVLLLDAQMVSTVELVSRAEEQGIALICSVDDDPIEAEANFRHALDAIPGALADAGGGVWWLRRDGVKRPSPPTG